MRADHWGAWRRRRVYAVRCTRGGVGGRCGAGDRRNELPRERARARAALRCIRAGPLPRRARQLDQGHCDDNDHWIAAVSRDRTWSLFERSTDAGSPAYALHSKSECHERIVWSVAWSHDDRFFATASRDKTIKIWERGESGTWDMVHTFTRMSLSVTAVDWAPALAGDRYMLAAGFDSGTVQIFACPSTDITKWELYADAGPTVRHGLTVNRIAWQPSAAAAAAPFFRLATCADDHAVRIFRVLLETT
eukprot:Opistho-1_new@49910